jgi:phytoene synthase
MREDAVVLYAWCRRADDAVDEAVDTAAATAALARLDAELDSLYRGEDQPDIVLQAFADVVRRTGLPKHYPAELLAGMRMDLEGTRYDSEAVLQHYCFRVAGTVGLMMCHVLGVTHEAALRRAAHLGMAMQLTNICRDIGEDWQRGRLYVPETVLQHWQLDGLPTQLGQPLASGLGPRLALPVRALLSEAAILYHSGRAGLRLLPWRAALAIGVAQVVYADIGRALAEQGYDPLRGRAHTSRGRKLWLTVCEAARLVGDLPRRWAGRGLPQQPRHGVVIQSAAEVLAP